MATTLNLNTAALLSVTIKRGDTMSFDITVKDSDGDAVDLSNYRFDMDVRTRRNTGSGSSRSDVVLSNNPGDSGAEPLSLVGVADGTLTISATAISTAAIKPGNYIFDIQATNNESGNVETWFDGSLSVVADISVR